MNKKHNLFDTLRQFDMGNGQPGDFYSLPTLEKAGAGPVSQLPVSIRLVLESVLRNCDGRKVTETNVRELAKWQPNAPRTAGNSIRCRPHRLAGFHRRAAAGGPGGHALRGGAVWARIPKIIEPLVPVDLVVDHSVQVDFAGAAEAMAPQPGPGVPHATASATNS